MNRYTEFTKALLQWYEVAGRQDLPWRVDHDPYKVWVSEIMLQQTQVPRVAGEYFPRFLKQFPTLESLAKADWEKDIYPAWKGLGYYGRARNMLRTAQILIQEYKGEFPRDAKELQALPGVGEYTAHAILSFAFDEKIPAIDTNIRKIIRILWPRMNVEKVAKELISTAPGGRDWNSAMMDLATALRAGQLVQPPLEKFFPIETAQKFFPTRKKSVTAKKPRKRRIEVGVGCIWKHGKYLIQTRPEGRSFTGQWEFPGGKREKGEDFRTCVKRETMEELGIEISVRPHFHEEIIHFSHVDLHLRFHRCQIQQGEPDPKEKQKIQWVSPTEFSKIDFLRTNAKAVAKLREMKV